MGRAKVLGRAWVSGRGRLAGALSGVAVTAVVVAGCTTPVPGGGGTGSTPTPTSTTAPVTPTPKPTTATPTPTPTPTKTPAPTPTPAVTPTTAPASSGGVMSGLHVSGKSIVNGSGQTVRLLGVNRSGSEYACIQNFGFFDGPSDDASIAAMASWKVNTVRVPLNEDCWLGINGAPAQYSGQAYRQQIEAYVGRINAHGMAAILDLHWNAAGTAMSTGQQKMADADHAPAFWQSVASTFKGNSSVVFDLYNEPHDVSWQCWRDGGDCGIGYQAAGMSTLLSTVRATGATNVVLMGGLGWGGDLSQWLANRPSDPTGNLAASVHTYNFSGCNNQSCWDSVIAPVTAAVPVVAGEIGENDCANSYIAQLMPWLDQHGAGYLGWGWDTYGCDFPGLISNYDGTPTTFGAGLRDHLRSLAG